MPRSLLLVPAITLAVVSGCKGEAPADPAAEAAGASNPVPATAAAAPAALAVVAMDKSRLADPCLLDAKAVGAAFGFTIDKTEPETLGDMYGCSYRGANGTIRLNMMWSDPVYFAKASETMRSASPGTKRDLAGDADRAWIQDYPPNLPVLHYYRQNVLVEVVPVIEGGPDPKAVEAALLKLARVP